MPPEQDKRCIECKHEICPFCRECHNPDCHSIVPPHEMCYKQLMPNTPESVEFKKLIPENVDILYDVGEKPICSRQAIANLIQMERKESCHGKGEKGAYPCYEGCFVASPHVHSKDGLIRSLPDKVEEWEKKMKEEWRMEIAKYPEMDALGSADWWLDKTRSHLKSEMPYAHGYADGLATGELLTAAQLSTLKGKVEGMRKEFNVAFRSDWEEERAFGFNSALDAVIHLIDTKE